ncbi:hypothetical protein [Winogradskyella sp.]|nr:hypothetical protein [Winogradskyella sp.]
MILKTEESNVRAKSFYHCINRTHNEDGTARPLWKTITEDG